jgi:hypothetical protein
MIGDCWAKNKIIKTHYYVAYGVSMKFDIKITKFLINSLRTIKS